MEDPRRTESARNAERRHDNELIQLRVEPVKPLPGGGATGHAACGEHETHRACSAVRTEKCEPVDHLPYYRQEQINARSGKQR